MRYGKVIACILTAVFLAAALIVGTMEEPLPAQPEPVGLALEISGETIFLWEQEPGRWIFFLPGYAQLSEGQFRVENHQKIAIDGQTIENGMSGAAFQPGQTYALTAEGTEGVVTFQRSGGVSTLFLDVRSGNMDYIHAEKGNQEPGNLRIYSQDGQLTYSGTLDINGRGNVTWENSEKKPYSLKLTAEADLLGLGSAQKWILIANGFDSSNLRNKSVFHFADAFGLACSPDCAWVDLYLNGEYAGLYLLSERNEIHPERVNIPQSGTLVSIDMEQRMARQDYPYIPIDGDTALRLHSGEKVTEEMTAFWKHVDNAIQAPDGIDPETKTHYLDYIDLDSWVRKYLIEEVFGNVEAGAVSHYFYMDGSGGKIYAGPVWDYDYALGSVRTWQTGTVEALFCARPYVWDESDTPWFYALWQKAEFRQEVIRLYEAEFRPALKALLETGLDQYMAEISAAADSNQRRWYRDLCPMEEETERIRTYLTARMAFLDSLWLEGETYYTVTANLTDGSVVSCYAVKPGEPLPQLPDTSWQEDAIGWYDYDTGEPFDENQPITENKRIYLKREEKAPAREGMAQRIIRYAPFAGLMLLLLTACLLDRNRRKGTKKQKNERTKHAEISS